MDYEKFKHDMEQDELKNLTNRGVEEFRYRYGYSENEIARIEGVSQPAVHDSIQAGLKKLKYMLNW